MKRFLHIIQIITGLLVVGLAEAQTVVSNESFPNSYNTGFARPVNATFTGSIGTWAAFSTDANATIVCNGAYVQTTPNALKIVNYNNSGLGTASTCRATSPTVNLGSLGCTNSVALSFKLYTYTLNVNNTCFSFFVEFSSDNGTNWTTIWSRTAQQLVQSFGAGTWTTQNIPIPANYFNSTFKYRLRGTQAAGCAYDSYLYVDDLRILSQACLTTCTTGFNPTAEAKGFNVFAKDGAKFMNGHTDGAVAMGGDLTLQGAATIAMNSAFLSYPVTADKFGLVVGGKMVYTSGAISYVNNGKIRLGSTTNSRLFYKDCNNANTNFRVTPFNATCATAYNLTPAVQQQSTSANSDPLDVTGINYTDAFSDLQTAATTIAAYTNSSSCASSLNVISISGNTPSVTLVANKTNVINLTGAQLTALTNITFNSAPTATNPLVINVNQTGSLNWTAPFSSTGLTNASGQFIIFNFYNATGDITIGGSNVIRGTLFAPSAAINWNSSNNLEGQAIARYFTLNGGEIHYQRFSACLPDCTPPVAGCVSSVNVTGGHSAVFNGVNYTMVNNSIRTTFTYTVTSGSSPNISHFIFGNYTCQSCFDDASDVISTSHTPIALGNDPTTGICGLKFDFGIASGQSTTVSFTLNGYYDVGTITFATKAGQNSAYGSICGPVCGGTPPSLVLGNLVWVDADNDGLKDTNESGLSNVTVRLYEDDNADNIPDGAFIATTTTDANGAYSFTTLPGKYIVGVVLPSGYTVTTTTGTSASPDNNTDNDNNGVTNIGGEIRSNYITMAAGTEPTTDGDGSNGNLTLDFGIKAVAVGSIGDFVFNDANGNGVQDVGELGIANVTVTLTGPNGTTVATTNASGFYQFTNLQAGSYTVTFTTPNGYVPAPSNIGTDDSKDSDPVNTAVSVNLTAGQNNVTIDAGFVLQSNCALSGSVSLGFLSNYLFVFTDGNVDANWQGATKGFIGDVVIDGIQASERTSGTVPYAGTIFTNNTTLDAWQNIITSNAAQAFSSFNQTTRINDLTTNLENAFTQINALTATAGYTGVSATALNGLNTQNGVAQTFVINVTSGFSISSKINITGDANDVFILRWDTDANFADGYEGQVKFQSGGAIVPLGGLTAANFVHVAGDIASSGGGSNPAAPYPQGPRTNNGTGSLITGGSDFAGGGFFTGYWLTTGSPTITGSGQPYGPTSSLSNAIFVGGWYSKTTQFSMTSGTSGVYVEPNTCVGSIGDFVWFDTDKDGIQDAGEVGISGATVTLTYPGGATATTTTNANGAYLFSNLPPGNYTVTFTTPNGFTASPSNIGTDDARDSDPVNGSVAVTLSSGENKLTVDAGFYPALSLGNFVWNDINGDGDFDQFEPGVAGVTVRLYLDANSNNIPDGAAIATTTTDAQGFYNFSGLTAGKYIVGVVIPSGYISSVSVGTSSNPDNNVDDDNNGINFTGANIAGTEVRSNFITLASATEPTDDGDGNNGNLTLDFGLCGTGGIGDFVFNDLDKDGIQDANEVGIQGVLVTLTYPDGTQLTVPTDEDGLYFFPNLGPGNYVVTFVTPAGQTATLSNQGSNDAIDSDPVAGTVNITLAANQVNSTVDAGFYLSTCVLQLGACGPGFVTKETTLIKNGNFSSSITSPAAGNTYSGTGSITYNFTGGNFKAQSAYDGLNIKPGSERDFSIINNAGIFNGGCCDVLQAAFPGDPANNVPASSTWLYHNGNDLGREFLVWEQTVTGLVVGRQYRFRFYASNAINGPNNADDPILRIRIGGTSGSNDGTVVTGPITLTESATANNTALSGWQRIEYSFTASATSMVLKITDSQTSTNGDDLGITAIGIESCFTDTDRDCVADVDDIDDDNDGILDIVESGGCDPLLDTDGDGIPNYKDSNAPGCQQWVDCNADGINDNFDWDRDGIINELDLDSDNDGILDVQETRADNAVDNNRDGMVDGVDVDGDGLLSTADANDNVIGGPGLTPQDLDRDGNPNYLDLDSDGDGLTDITEALELYDTDGLTAGTDVDIDGVRAKGGLYTNADDNADNFNGFGAKGIKLKDFDADGKPNPYDIDSDQDGITDNVEGQPTCSNKVPCTEDADDDGVGDCYDTNTSNCTSRTSGGITPFDKDGDGTPDIYDLDTDNDGAPDINEGSGREGGFVEDYSDVDGDGLIGEFDNFNIVTALSNFTNNVAHGNMGPNGNLDGPIPSGSLAELPQSQVGSCPTVDRDWRNVTILPVTLMEFKGNLNNSLVNLQWKVTNEVSVERYIVERSTNGTNFTGIAAVNATSASTSVKDYQHQDNIASLNTSIVYYRLITEDKGGSKQYSNTIVFRLGKAKSTMAINPNPASNFFNVRVQATKEGNATVRVLDMMGRVVLTNNTKLFTGSNTISFNNAQQLAAGTYSVQMLLHGEVFTEKLMIMH